MLIDREKLMQAKETLADRNAELMAEALGLNYDEKKCARAAAFTRKTRPASSITQKIIRSTASGARKLLTLSTC